MNSTYRYCKLPCNSVLHADILHNANCFTSNIHFLLYELIIRLPCGLLVPSQLAIRMEGLIVPGGGAKREVRISSGTIYFYFNDSQLDIGWVGHFIADKVKCMCGGITIFYLLIKYREVYIFYIYYIMTCGI